MGLEEEFDLCLTGKLEGRRGNEFRAGSKLGTELSRVVTYASLQRETEAPAAASEGVAKTHPAKSTDHRTVVAPPVLLGDFDQK